MVPAHFVDNLTSIWKFRKMHQKDYKSAATRGSALCAFHLYSYLMQWRFVAIQKNNMVAVLGSIEGVTLDFLP